MLYFVYDRKVIHDIGKFAIENVPGACFELRENILCSVVDGYEHEIDAMAVIDNCPLPSLVTLVYATLGSIGMTIIKNKQTARKLAKMMQKYIVGKDTSDGTVVI